METEDPLAKVDQPNAQHHQCDADWMLADDLYSSTSGMRAAAERYLPKRYREKQDIYDYRLRSAFLYPGFVMGCEDLTSRPFERPVMLDGAGKQQQVIEEDCDRARTSLSEHLGDRYRQGLKYGVTHVLIDFSGWRSQSARDELPGGAARPYFVPISPRDLIDWDEVNDKLVMIRFRSSKIERVADFETRRIPLVIRWQLIEDGTIAIHQWAKRPENDQPNAKSVWRLEVEKIARAAKPFPELPFDTVWFGTPVGRGAQSPLRDLAWKNVEHWAASSRYNYALDFATGGIIYTEGMRLEEIEKQGGVSLGGSHFLAFEKEGSVNFAEAKGSGIEPSGNRCEALVAEMRALGARHLQERKVASTATEQRIDESNSTSNVKQWSKLLEAGAMRCFRWASFWLNAELPASFTVRIHSDFSAPAVSGSASIEKARDRGDISHQTYLEELQRMGDLDARRNIEEEVEKAQQEKDAAMAKAWKMEQAAQGEGRNGGDPGDGAGLEDDDEEQQGD